MTKFPAAKFSSAIGFALLGLIAPQSGGRQQALAAPIMTTGTLKIGVDLRASKAIADRTAVSVFVIVTCSDATYYNEVAKFSRKKVIVSDGKASETFTAPYDITVTNRPAQINVTVFANASAGTSASMTELTQSIDLPADGATTVVHFVGGI